MTFSGRNLVDGNSSNVGFSSFKADFNVGGGDEPGGAYREVLLGCEGVSLSGSAKIDSYDSRKGAYGAKLEDGGYNRNGTQGIISTNADKDGNVTLNGSSPIYGQVRATGNVTASGSASIHGDIQANGDVIISGGGSKILGNVASRQAVRLSSSGLVEGNVKANTEIVTGNWSSRIEGDATAPVVRTTTNRDVAEQVEGTINLTSPNVGEVTTASCDSFTTREGATIGELSDALAPYASSGSLSIGGGNQTYTLTPSGLQVPADRNNNSVPNPDSYQVTRDVTVEGVFPEPTNALVLDSFSLGGSANFVVDGGDMTLYVKGDINIGGGASFTVAEGSSLKIVTDGRFNLPSGLDIASDSGTDDEGNPILSIYSTFDDGGASGWNAGVNISGNSTFRGTIFAPYSTVNVGGSGELFGAVKGQRVEVSGSGDIHYDEALMESSIGTGDGGSGNEAGDGEGGENNGGTTWTLVGLSYGQPEE
ncbi:polymer-forming cytoskeletal protein [Chromohalobacter sp. HP20-39]|uniref:polymer-forming cytoskeletal protein n=1 Tax=Chromohalobacter sp. HP20-39 TaxID=3079306 RepID=UPI00294B6A21|nr:polymer-forming cytoskeletal protein [Chromohalobacter sp. HP20-39]MDV6320500.1 polymer-forming cytoskeletal protein [Chromohalobacter sp. HP20-39]